MKSLSVTETAKLVRKQLKAHFPGQKFSVRSDSYSMGAAIRIRYEDGPWLEDVNEVVKPFESSGFDGMIDLKYYKSSWLLPDGSAVPAKSEGTENSRGVRPAYNNMKPHPDAEQVSFGADYVTVTREMSDETKVKIKQYLEGWLGLEPGTFESSKVYPYYDGLEQEQGWTLLRQRFSLSGPWKDEHPAEIAEQAKWAKRVAEMKAKELEGAPA